MPHQTLRYLARAHSNLVAPMTLRGRRPRILVQVNSLELGGSQINAVDLAAGVTDLGFEPILIGPADSRPCGPSLFDVAADRGVRVEPFRRPLTTLSGARELSRLAAEHRADLVHVYGTWSIRPAYWGPCALARRPLVITVYEMDVDPVVYTAPPLIVGTGYLVDELIDRRGQVRLISPPVDLERDNVTHVQTQQFLQQHDLDPRNVRVVIVSRLDGEPLRPVKTTAVEAALGAMARLDRPDVDLVVVGTGKDAAQLRSLAQEVNARLGRRGCVFTGPLHDPRPAYASADVVLGMGGSAARGLAFGKPLIVTGEYGWFDTFRPETAQRLFRNSFWSEEIKSDPADELLRDLAPLLEDGSERCALGAYGRGFAESHFSLSAMSQRLADVYEQAFSYGPADWLHDLRLESKWAAGWLGRHFPMPGSISRRARAWSDPYRARGAFTPPPSAGSLQDRRGVE